MASNASDAVPGLSATAGSALKIAVVGPLGVGKTTLVGSVSEISPLTTEEVMSRAGAGVDRTAVDGGVGGGGGGVSGGGEGGDGGVTTKTTTTVAMDFGRITLDERLVLYLFGTPGQERFWFLWDGLVNGALGAVVLVDVRRLEESFEVLERLEDRGVAFIVAANCFPGAPVFPPDTLRTALDLPASVPIVNFDARERASCREVLLALGRYLLALADPDGAADV